MAINSFRLLGSDLVWRDATTAYLGAGEDHPQTPRSGAASRKEGGNRAPSQGERVPCGNERHCRPM